MTCTRCWFVGNSCGGSDGGAIDAFNTVDIIECTFRHNRAAGSGGAIISSGSLTVHGCLFDTNTATLSGGAIYSTGPLSVRGNSSFSACVTLELVGAAVYSRSEGDISETVVREFSSSNASMAVFYHDPVDQSVLVLRGVAFQEVKVLFVASSQPGTIVVYNCDFSLADVDDATTMLTCDDPGMRRYCSSDHCTDVTAGIEVLLSLFNFTFTFLHVLASF